MDIVIPTMEDYEVINVLATQVHELHVMWRPDLFNSVEKVITEEELKDMIEKGEIYVAKIDGKVVGYIVFGIVEKIYNNPKVRNKKLIDIDAMCVDENYRGKGIGTKLLEFAQNVGLENNCTDIYLTVNEENVNAIKTYEKFGMRIKNLAYSKQIGGFNE